MCYVRLRAERNRGGLVRAMKGFLENLASRRRFGMKAGLENITQICEMLGSPHKAIDAIHIAGTNGKGACAAIIDSALTASGLCSGRYTSPHLLKLNERFFVGGRPVDDRTLDSISQKVEAAVNECGVDATFFEALTAVAFCLYAQLSVDAIVMETGLGGRLDATNICSPVVTVITRIGLDHCDWLGTTLEEIANEKAGIIKPGVSVVLGENCAQVREVVEDRARKLGSRFYYAPDIVSKSELPGNFSLAGSFNAENAVTALAALKVIKEGKLLSMPFPGRMIDGFANVQWPCRFQKIGNAIVDGAHNPPAARALVDALAEFGEKRFTLVAGFCSDKDVAETLSILAPRVKRAIAVKTNNPRSIDAPVLAAAMREAGIDSSSASSLREALDSAGVDTAFASEPEVLVCGSLFLAGEALAALGAYPWGDLRFDPSELLKSQL